ANAAQAQASTRGARRVTGFTVDSRSGTGPPERPRAHSERDRDLHGVGVAADRGVLAGRDAAVGDQLDRGQRRGEGRDRLVVGGVAAPGRVARGVLVDVVAQALGAGAGHLPLRVGAGRTGGRVVALVERGHGGGGAAGAAHVDRAAGVGAERGVGVGRVIGTERDVGGGHRAAGGDGGGDLEVRALRRGAGEGAAGERGGAHGEEKTALVHGRALTDGNG